MARFLATVGFLVLAALVVNRFTESPGPPAELASEARVDSDAEAAASPKEIIAPSSCLLGRRCDCFAPNDLENRRTA